MVQLCDNYVNLQMSTVVLPTDRRVLEKVKQLVHIGVRRLPEMQRHVRHFVENDLFGRVNVPPQTDSRYWPSSKSLMNCIYRTSCALRFADFCV